MTEPFPETIRIIGIDETLESNIVRKGASFIRKIRRPIIREIIKSRNSYTFTPKAENNEPTK
jgi:hypothetical protein